MVSLHARAGRTRIHLNRWGEVYTLVPPQARVHNIVIGRTWVDACGLLRLHCPTSGVKCELEFSPCGWFGYGRHEFSGYVVDAGVRGRGEVQYHPNYLEMSWEFSFSV